MTARVFAPICLVLSIVFSACGGTGDEGGGSNGTAPQATGSVSADAASTAMLALCEIVGETDLDTAAAAFHDRAHETLHAIAGEVGDVDRAIEADLLTAKSTVESDLEAGSLPPSFGTDVAALISATGTALEAIGLTVLACPA